jgi:cbb3-type cytochrome oxidase subunit 3
VIVPFLSTNPLFHRAGEVAQDGWIMGVMTVVFLLTFAAWSLYAYAPWAREAHEQNARIPFSSEED